MIYGWSVYVKINFSINIMIRSIYCVGEICSLNDLNMWQYIYEKWRLTIKKLHWSYVDSPLQWFWFVPIFFRAIFSAFDFVFYLSHFVVAAFIVWISKHGSKMQSPYVFFRAFFFHAIDNALFLQIKNIWPNNLCLLHVLNTLKLISSRAHHWYIHSRLFFFCF